eukprot:432875-Pleurochrysis_carterae.AAC.1
MEANRASAKREAAERSEASRAAENGTRGRKASWRLSACDARGGVRWCTATKERTRESTTAWINPKAAAITKHAASSPAMWEACVGDEGVRTPRATEFSPYSDPRRE